MYIFDRSYLFACTKSKHVPKKELNGIFLHNPRGARIFSQGSKLREAWGGGQIAPLLFGSLNGDAGGRAALLLAPQLLRSHLRPR